MDFKRYLTESEFAATNPVEGDQFNIVVNEVVNIQTTVVESVGEKVTLKLDPKAKSVLEGVGVVFEAPSVHTYVSGRDFTIEAEYKGYAMGDESIDDDDGFTKYGYGVYKFVKTTTVEHNGTTYKQNHYRRICDLIDPATGREPSPYAKGYEKMFQYTVDKLTSSKMASMGEDAVEKEDNFTADDIKDLSSIRDLNVAKAKALQLISHQGRNSMKPNKVAWLKHAIASKKSVMELIKLMYDLMLSGEGNSVIGSKSSTAPNSYRKAFGERAFEGNDVYVVNFTRPDGAQDSFKLHADDDAMAERKAAVLMKVRKGCTLKGIKKLSQAVSEDAELANLRRLSGLNEGYEDRIQDVANKLVQHSRVDSIKKEHLDGLIDVFARETPEYRMKNNPKSKAWPDFKRDLKKALVGKIRWHNGASAARAEDTNNKLAQIAQVIQTAVGNAFPDGDPFDHILPKLQRMGLDTYETIDWLDKAAKKYLGAKNYYNYLHNVWQDYMDDNPGAYGLTDNPWNESLDEEDDEDILTMAESTIADRIVSVTKELEKKSAQKKSGSTFDSKVDEKIAALKRELKTLEKRKPVTESKGTKLYADGYALNFGSSVVNIMKANVSGSVVLYQVAESTTKSVPWVCKVTTDKSVGSAYIPRK